LGVLKTILGGQTVIEKIDIQGMGKTAYAQKLKKKCIKCNRSLFILDQEKYCKVCDYDHSEGLKP
jgi:hypothetical protein